MGIISDIYERNRERTEWWLWVEYCKTIGREPDDFGRSSEEKKAPEPLPCPFCSARLTGEDALQTHIFNVHRHIHFYLRVNGRVIHESRARVIKPLTTLSVHVIGLEGPVAIAYQAVGNDRVEKHTVERGWLSKLHRLLPNVSLRWLELSLDEGRSIHLEFVEPSAADLDRLDREIEALVDEILLAGPTVDWREWRQRFIEAARNEAEDEYLRGHYDYLHAYWLETVRGPDAADDALRLCQQAFAPLAAFPSARSILACRAIAFKLNWFDTHSFIDPRSIFALASAFFALPLQQWLKRSKQWLDSVEGETARVLVDPYHQLLLETVRDFARADYARLEQRLTELAEHPLGRVKRSYRDKLHLLGARYFRQVGDLATSRELYEELRGHHLFGKEAEEFAA